MTEDGEYMNLGDLCVFARDVIVCVSRLYGIFTRKSAQENRILTSSNTNERKAGGGRPQAAGRS